MRIAVVGAGSWGTTLADLLVRKSERVRLWAYEPEVAEDINRKHENELYLPGISLAENLQADTDLAGVVDGSEIVVLVCPSHVMRSLLLRLAGKLNRGVIIVNAGKGLENKTLLRMSQVEAEVLPGELDHRHVTLS